MKPKGWKNEPGRHSLAAKGIKTGKKNVNAIKYHSSKPTKFYEVVIHETGKPVGKPDFDDDENMTSNFTTFNLEKQQFGSLQEAKDFIKERYERVKAKRKKLFRDTKEGPEQSGTLYRYRNGTSDPRDEPWIQEDWVEIKEIQQRIVR